MIIKNKNGNFEIDKNVFLRTLEQFKHIYLENKDLDNFMCFTKESNYQGIYDWILKNYRIDLQKEYKDFIESEIQFVDFDDWDFEPYYTEPFKYKIIYKSGDKIRFRNVLDNAKEIGNELAEEYKDYDNPGDVIIQDSSNNVISIKKFIHRNFDRSEYDLLYFDVWVKDDIIIGKKGYYTEWILIV